MVVVVVVGSVVVVVGSVVVVVGSVVVVVGCVVVVLVVDPVLVVVAGFEPPGSVREWEPAVTAATVPSRALMAALAVCPIEARGPSWPTSLRPQANRSPSRCTASVWKTPASNAATSLNGAPVESKTGAGVSRPSWSSPQGETMSLEPLPPPSTSARPQAHTSPVAVRARLWPPEAGPPAAKATTSWSSGKPLTWVGRLRKAVVSALGLEPSCPEQLLPQDHTLPSPVRAKLWSLPAANAITFPATGTLIGTDWLRPLYAGASHSS